MRKSTGLTNIKSYSELETYVRGREFIVHSARASRLWKSLALGILRPRTRVKQCLTSPIIRSYDPANHGARGVIVRHTAPQSESCVHSSSAFERPFDIFLFVWRALLEWHACSVITDNGAAGAAPACTPTLGSARGREGSAAAGTCFLNPLFNGLPFASRTFPCPFAAVITAAQAKEGELSPCAPLGSACESDPVTAGACFPPLGGSGCGCGRT